MTLTIYMLTALLIWGGYFLFNSRTRQRHAEIFQRASQSGLTEPVSLHPHIDSSKCIGCASCVYACPEETVLGVINGKGQLINPSHCIGHGACAAACPVEAISLVFGSEKRGVDIPVVKPNFETNVPGIFIAGELGGMGLIRNAVEQGRQAVESIRKTISRGNDDVLDVVVVGAGPAGIAASLTAMSHHMRFVTLEQDTLGGAVAHFPRAKVVMTKPVKLPIVGSVKFTETSKENLLAFWERIVVQTGLKIRFHERVESIFKDGDILTITTAAKRYRARSVLLCIGRRGTPRKLGVEGEQLSKVVYRLIDAEQYAGQRVLVVGGGDSALEAAISIANVPNTTVTLSYRSENFNRAKEANRRKLEAARSAGNLKVMLGSNVVRIRESSVLIEQGGKTGELPNDAVIVCAGGILPSGFLKEIGVEVETKYGTA
ncbi:MAG: NAD(P)-binding domain-containing protein [Gammaproteobacteria bacterium]